ncbi:hypothetical protein ACFL1E_02040 [Candidatus Omnitrophota bacterium]
MKKLLKGGYNMFRRLLAMAMCLVVLTTASVVFAEDVYVTQRGKKYHKQDCRYIQNREVEKINNEEAEARGLAPCGSCFKNEDQQVQQESKNNEGEELVCAVENFDKP